MIQGLGEALRTQPLLALPTLFGAGLLTSLTPCVYPMIPITAAVIAGLDCVVTIDSAVAHLAGAMAKPAFVMLSHAGEWRWLDKRTDSPWYPTLQLVRQPQPGAWDSVVQRIGERLLA